MNVHLSWSRFNTLRENLEIIEKNGFKAEYQGSNQIIKLVSLPIARNTTFGEEGITLPPNKILDLFDLLDEIEKNPYEKKELRVAKLKSVFASRACRASIMVGDALSANQMKGVLSNLSILKSPWNCPHGRPTLITLGDLRKRKILIKNDTVRRGIDLTKLETLH